jgi:enoyl-[acyl-carrier protein] reductase I
MFSYQKKNSPLRRAITADDVGDAAVYLLSDLSRSVTGEIHYVDAGYNIVAMPPLATLKSHDERAPGDLAE